MKTIGQIIKDARNNKRYSYQELENITKIKTCFIEAIENENWQLLPSFSTVLGFVKSLSSALGLDEKTSAAIFKRDYPPKKININPKPDVSSKPAWNPKTAFVLGIVLVAVLVLGYLGFQYKRFLSPPALTVMSPAQGQVITERSVLVFGSTDPDAKITVDNQPVLVDSDGKFSTNISVADDTSEVIVTAQSRNGKITTVSRKINVTN